MTSISLSQKDIRFWQAHQIETRQLNFTIRDIQQKYDLTHQLFNFKQKNISTSITKQTVHHQAQNKLLPKNAQQDEISLFSYVIVVLVFSLLTIYFMKKRTSGWKKQTYNHNQFNMIQYHEQQNPQFPHLHDND